jgi:hypothetical protein
LWRHVELKLQRHPGSDRARVQRMIEKASPGAALSVRIPTMREFDYTAPAELFASHGRSGLRYRRFSRSADAIRYAVEKLPAAALSAASLEVDDHRYGAAEIRALYQSDLYPLARE